MDNNLLARQLVAVDGYKWISLEGIGPSTRYIVPCSLVATSGQYDPLNDFPRLYRTFASIETDSSSDAAEAEILTFANSYGLLQCPAPIDIMHGSLQPVFVEFGAAGCRESFEFWESKITTMRHVVALWDAVRDAEESEDLDLKYLRARLCVEIDLMQPRSSDADGPFQRKALSMQEIQAYISGLDKDALIQVGKLKLLGWINANLESETHSSLMLLRSGGMRLHTVPKGLLGAMWLQFVYEVTGSKSYSRCANCGRYFETGQATKRAHAKYCSSSCRYQAYRKAKKERADESP